MLKHSIFEGIKNLVRSFWLSITAIFIIFVSLTSVAFVSSLWVVVGYALRQFDSQAIILVFIKSNTVIEERVKMEGDIKGLSEVKSVVFIDKQKAEEELKTDPVALRSYTAYQKAESNSKNKTNPLLEYYKVTPTTVDTYNKVLDFIKQDKYSVLINEISGTQEYIDFLQKLYYWTAIIGFFLVVIFGLISILVMVNILRIAIYSRRDEIEIMRLVGATNAYIRGPFIAEGILYNFIASIFVFVLFIPAFMYVLPLLNQLFGISIGSDITGLTSGFYLSLTVTNILGLVVGGLSAMIATQRYLKL
jgi:cell division transport system permease protein